MKKQSFHDGAQAFENYYQGIFGDRWTSLRQALVREVIHQEISEGLLHPYHLDGASILAAKALGACEDEIVLDLCAAPGGKSLVLLSQAPRLQLICNERSTDRRERLRRVLREHLPGEVFSRVQISGHDGRRWVLYAADSVDRVLLDAPCSSERHVLASSVHLSRWSPRRPAELARDQYALLASALGTVRVGGTICYVTCAVDPAENDGVVQRLLTRRKGEVRLDEVPFHEGEPTRCGRQIYPDTSEGMGPMYVARLVRTE